MMSAHKRFLLLRFPPSLLSSSPFNLAHLPSHLKDQTGRCQEQLRLHLCQLLPRLLGRFGVPYAAAAAAAVARDRLAARPATSGAAAAAALELLFLLEAVDLVAQRRRLRLERHQVRRVGLLRLRARLLDDEGLQCREEAVMSLGREIS